MSMSCHHIDLFMMHTSFFRDLFTYLEDRLTQSTVNSIDIEELCPFGCNKKQAAFVFITLLGNEQFHFILRCSLDLTKIIKSLEWCLRSTLFIFRGEIYQQSEGVAIESPVSPVVANLFTHSLESSVILNSEVDFYFIHQNTINQCDSVHIKWNCSLPNNVMNTNAACFLLHPNGQSSSMSIKLTIDCVNRSS
ncbi:reverse transcriptase [Schistosoma japonicum]|nr:reverse transcriptase [Schistosoma japonicum]